MRLFEAVPSELFSVLASPNRELYADALEILYVAFEDKLKVPEEEYYNLLMKSLERQLDEANFEGEDISEAERRGASGHARFLIRKLSSRGWLEKERGRDLDGLKEYLILPGYSSRILELLHQLRDNETMRGVSYVFATCSALEMAQEGKKSKGDDLVYEKMVAVYTAYDNTQALVKMLQTVYGSIKSYFQKQIDMQEVNQVLAAHFDDFGQKVIEAYIRPLKVKDSVPKYRVPIQEILNQWSDDNDLLMAMASAALRDRRRDTLDACVRDLRKKIDWIKERYEHIESEYLDEIDEQVRRYTRATTQKLEALTNRDQSTKGNLQYLLARLSQEKNADALVEKIQPAFHLYQQGYLSEKSLWLRKRPTRKPLSETLAVEEESVSQEAQEKAMQLLYAPYSQESVAEYVQDLFGERKVLYSKDMGVQDDHTYVMSLLAVLYGRDRSSAYWVEDVEGNHQEGLYAIPQYKLIRKEEK